MQVSTRMSPSKIDCTCANCGKVIQKWPYELRTGRNLFCSRSCVYAFQKGRLVGAKNLHWKGGLVTRTCEHCGNDWDDRRDLESRGGGRYCSATCRDKAKERRQSFVCVMCAGHFERTPTPSRKGVYKFCSLKCMREWNAINLTGANHPAWKGGTSAPHTSPARQSEYYHQRRARLEGCEINDFTKEQWAEVLAEFNYHCAYCLQPVDSFDMEHMTPISRGGNNTKTNVVPACRRCNVTKNKRTLLEYASALEVRV